MRFNDVSVLENHHIAFTFNILSMENYNIFKDLSRTEFKRVRKIMIGAVLATDMSMHFNKVGMFKSKLNSPDYDP